MLKQVQWKLRPIQHGRSWTHVHLRLNGQPQTLCGRDVKFGSLTSQPTGKWCVVCKRRAEIDHLGEFNEMLEGNHE